MTTETTPNTSTGPAAPLPPSQPAATGNGKRKSAKYMDGMFKNCVVAPAEVKAKGMEYFDDNEDLKTAEKLIAAIEQFLRS